MEIFYCYDFFPFSDFDLRLSVLVVIQFVRIYATQMRHTPDSYYILFQTLIYLQF